MKEDTFTIWLVAVISRVQDEIYTHYLMKILLQLEQ